MAVVGPRNLNDDGESVILVEEDVETPEPSTPGGALSGLLSAVRRNRAQQEGSGAEASRSPEAACPMHVARPHRSGVPRGAQVMLSADTPLLAKTPIRVGAGLKRRADAASQQDVVAWQSCAEAAAKRVKREFTVGAVPELSASARCRVDHLLSSARKGAANGRIPASEFSPDTKVEGRPQRRRFPVLERWRCENVVFERQPGSLAPTVREVRVLPGAAMPPPAPLGRTRLKAEPTTPREGKSAAAYRGRRRAPADELPPGGAAAAPQPAPEAAPASSDAPAVVAEACAPPPPLRSALRRRGDDGPPKARIRFAPQAVTRGIENHSALGPELWYDGFVVECDRCDRAIEWGAEGSNVMGSPGRSRFAQWQVLCSGCSAERVYAEIGAWFVVALAADSSDGAGVGGRVAEEPIVALLGSLAHLARGKVREDLLTALLGPEAEDPEVRGAVLRKARAHAPKFLGHRRPQERGGEGPPDPPPASGDDEQALPAAAPLLLPRVRRVGKGPV